MRVIALSFFGLALFVTVDAARTLLGATEPDHSTVGIVLASVSLVVMPFLSWFERRTGRELGSASAVADSKQTMLCTYLSAVLLVGLLLNSTLGWTWADPLAALVIAGVAIKEGIEAWRGDACCTPASALLPTGETTPDGCADGCCGPPERP
jgi:divalent metal cation (Fe/Co/Zn/Cd) transporter